MFFSNDFDFESFSNDSGPRGHVDNDRLYKILEVDKDANQSQIKRAFHKLAIKHHPDKNGDPEKVQ